MSKVIITVKDHYDIQKSINLIKMVKSIIPAEHADLLNAPILMLEHILKSIQSNNTQFNDRGIEL